MSGQGTLAIWAKDPRCRDRANPGAASLRLERTGDGPCGDCESHLKSVYSIMSVACRSVADCWDEPGLEARRVRMPKTSGHLANRAKLATRV